MGGPVRARALLVVTTALAIGAAGAVACSDDDGDRPDGFTVDVDEPLGGLEPGSAPLPPEEIRDVRLLSVDRSPDRDQRGAVVVSRIDDHVVTVAVVPDRTWEDVAAGAGAAGPVIDGRPTALVPFEATFSQRNAVAVELDDQAVVVASWTAGVEELAEVAAAVELPLTEGVAGGEVIGVIGAEPRFEITYLGDDGGGRNLLVELVDPAAQAAYEAIALDEPSTVIDEATIGSCCDDSVMDASRTLAVAGRTALSATVSPYERILLVPGAPVGLVVSPASRMDDDFAVSFVEGVQGGKDADLDALVARIDAAEAERRLASLEQHERGIGWEVLADGADRERAWVLSTGPGNRREVVLDQELDAAVCLVADIGDPNHLAEACVPSGMAVGPGLLDAAPDHYSELMIGVVGDGIATVEVEFVGGAVPMEVVDVPPGPGRPARVFALLLDEDEQVRLTGELTAANVFATDYVGRDASGAEVARIRAFDG